MSIVPLVTLLLCPSGNIPYTHSRQKQLEDSKTMCILLENINFPLSIKEDEWKMQLGKTLYQLNSLV
jgi:hypothetical protein